MQSVLLNSYVSLALPNFPNRSSINPSQFTTLGYMTLPVTVSLVINFTNTSFRLVSQGSSW